MIEVGDNVFRIFSPNAEADHLRRDIGGFADFLSLLDRLERRWFRDGSADPDLYESWRSLHARLSALPEVR